MLLAVHLSLALSLPATPLPASAAARFSLYPKVSGEQSLKQAIKDAVSGIGGLGLAVAPDDVSSVLIGDARDVLEGLRGAFGRAAALDGLPHVSMPLTLSSGDGAHPFAPAPARTLPAGAWDEIALPARIACQLAAYPLGVAAEERARCAADIAALAAEAGCLKSAELPLSDAMLDGDGEAVFGVLRAAFGRACDGAAADAGGGAVLVATLTANKASWKAEARS